jgi:hypothetical protein
VPLALERRRVELLLSLAFQIEAKLRLLAFLDRQSHRLLPLEHLRLAAMRLDSVLHNRPNR